MADNTTTPPVNALDTLTNSARALRASTVAAHSTQKRPRAKSVAARNRSASMASTTSSTKPKNSALPKFRSTVSNPGEDTVDSNLEVERPDSVCTPNEGTIRQQNQSVVKQTPLLVAQTVDSNTPGIEPITEENGDASADDDCVDEVPYVNYGVGFDPAKYQGYYAKNPGYLQLDSGVRVRTDFGNVKKMVELAQLKGCNSTPPEMADWEPISIHASAGHLVGGSDLHPYEMAGYFEDKLLDDPKSTPNAQELAYLVQLVRGLEEGRRQQGDYIQRLEIQVASAMGQLDSRCKDEFRAELKKISNTVGKIENELDTFRKSNIETDEALTAIRLRLLALENGHVHVTGVGQGASSKRKLQSPEVAHTVVRSAKRPRTIQAISEMEVLSGGGDPTDPFGGHYPWKAEAKAVGNKTLASTALNLHQLFAVTDGLEWNPEFHKFDRQCKRIMGNITRYVTDHSVDTSKTWFKSGNGRQSTTGFLYSTVDEAKKTFAYTALLIILQNAAENNVGLRQLLWASGHDDVEGGWIITDREIRCAGESPNYGWKGALMSGYNKGRLECTVPTCDGPHFKAPYMNLYGEALMEIRETLTEESVFSKRLDNGELEYVPDKKSFSKFHGEKQFCAMDFGNLYARTMANLKPPQWYLDKRRNDAELRKGGAQQPNRGGRGSQRTSQRDASQGNPVDNRGGPRDNRGQNFNSRGWQRGRYGGSQRGRNTGCGMYGGGRQQRTAHQQTQNDLASMQEPIVDTQPYWDGDFPDLSNPATVAHGPDVQMDTVVRAGRLQRMQQPNFGADEPLINSNPGMFLASTMAPLPQRAAPKDGTYAGHAQASVAAGLPFVRKTTIQPPTNQVRASGVSTMKHVVTRSSRLIHLNPLAAAKLD